MSATTAEGAPAVGQTLRGVRSDDASIIGVHVFERAGLGKAPFKCVGFSVRKYQACPGAPIQPGGCCAYCGTGIMDCFEIKGSSPTEAGNATFIVGCDCVMRTGDAGLIRSYKQNPEYRALQKSKRDAKDDANKAQWAEWMADEPTVQKLAAHQVPVWGGKGTRSWLDYATNSWAWSGASGRAKLVRAARKILTGAL